MLGCFEPIDIRGRADDGCATSGRTGREPISACRPKAFRICITLVGPHNAATFSNMPRCIEQNVEWVTGLLRFMRERGHTRVVPTSEAEAAWTEHVYETASRMLLTKVDSWFMGINSNVPGKQKRTFLLYAGGAPYYRQRCDEIASHGYEGFRFSGSRAGDTVR